MARRWTPSLTTTESTRRGRQLWTLSLRAEPGSLPSRRTPGGHSRRAGVPAMPWKARGCSVPSQPRWRAWSARALPSLVNDCALAGLLRAGHTRPDCRLSKTKSTWDSQIRRASPAASSRSSSSSHYQLRQPLHRICHPPFVAVAWALSASSELCPATAHAAAYHRLIPPRPLPDPTTPQKDPHIPVPAFSREEPPPSAITGFAPSSPESTPTPPLPPPTNHTSPLNHTC